MEKARQVAKGKQGKAAEETKEAKEAKEAKGKEKEAKTARGGSCTKVQRELGRGASMASPVMPQ